MIVMCIKYRNPQLKLLLGYFSFSGKLKKNFLMWQKSNVVLVSTYHCLGPTQRKAMQALGEEAKEGSKGQTLDLLEAEPTTLQHL